MVFYDFRCETCNTIIEKEFYNFAAYEDLIEKKEIICEVCNEALRRSYSTSSIHIPEYMRADTEDNASQDYAKHIMNKAKRPSGKEKIYY